MDHEIYKLLVFLIRIYNFIGFVLLLRGFWRHYKIFASDRMREETRHKITLFAVGLVISLLINITSFVTGNMAIYLFAAVYNSSIIYFCAYIINRQARRLETLKFAPELVEVQRAIDSFFLRANAPHRY